MLTMLAILTAALSGIQDYLFAVAHEGGRQARRLRARSFFIQLAAECAALRLQRVLGGEARLIASAASKLTFDTPPLDETKRARLAAERRDIERWLLTEVGAGLRFAMAEDSGPGTARERFERAQAALQADKLRGWASVAVDGDGWCAAALVLPPLGTPCDLCHQREGKHPDVDDETGVERLICHRCHEDARLGGELVRARWLVIGETPQPDDFDVVGLRVALSRHATPAALIDRATLAVTNLERPDDCPPGVPRHLHLVRRLMRHVPVDRDRGRPLEFKELAEHARGDALLAVLKMDADSLGAAVSRQLAADDGFAGLRDFSDRLDRFFAATLQAEIKRSWRSLYTVFSGGDDLLLIGPWNQVLELAGEVAQRFAVEFPGLTISAGIALVKPTQPIRHSAVEAERLLEEAKHWAAPQAAPKDQCAALGQIWKWRDHQRVLAEGKRLASWVERDKMQRGWLHTLLDLALVRGRDPLATARLAHHVARNYPRLNDRDPERVELRKWADTVLADFEAGSAATVAYLPAALRYALAATRTK